MKANVKKEKVKTIDLHNKSKAEAYSLGYNAGQTEGFATGITAFYSLLLLGMNNYLDQYRADKGKYLFPTKEKDEVCKGIMKEVYAILEQGNKQESEADRKGITDMALEHQKIMAKEIGIDLQEMGFKDV